MPHTPTATDRVSTQAEPAKASGRPEPARPGDSEAFKQALHAARDPGQSRQDLSGEQDETERFSGSALAAGDRSALADDWLAYSTPSSPTAQPGAAVQPSASAGGDPSHFVDLMARHVQNMLVSEPRTGSVQQEQQLLMRLTDQVLPNTQVMLTRSARGWTLKAESSGEEELNVIRQSTDSLVERFQQAGLGALEVITEHQPSQRDPSGTGFNTMSV